MYYMNEETFRYICIKLVKKYTEEYVKENNILSDWDVYVVWQCKTLQNNKALLATTLSDNKYFEITYNGDKEEVYFDAYVKEHNEAINIKQI